MQRVVGLFSLRSLMTFANTLDQDEAPQNGWFHVRSQFFYTDLENNYVIHQKNWVETIIWKMLSMQSIGGYFVNFFFYEIAPYEVSDNLWP